MKSSQHKTRNRDIVLVVILFTLFAIVLIVLIERAFRGIAYNLDRVHPDEMEVRDWLNQVGGRWSRSADSERHITGVYLDGLDVTKEDLKRLTKLTKLSTLTLNDTNITDEFIPYINDLKSLDDLEINRTKITWEGWCKLDVYGLNHNAIEDTKDQINVTCPAILQHGVAEKYENVDANH